MFVNREKKSADLIQQKNKRKNNEKKKEKKLEKEKKEGWPRDYLAGANTVSR